MESPAVFPHHKVDGRGYDDVNTRATAERGVPQPLRCRQRE